MYPWIAVVAVVWFMYATPAAADEVQVCPSNGECFTYDDDKHEIRLVPVGTKMNCVEVTGIKLKDPTPDECEPGLVVSPRPPECLDEE